MNVRMATAAIALIVAPGIGWAEGDATNGEKVYKKCKVCHVADEEKNKVGPHLVGIIGRKAGAVADYKYSEAMMAKGAEGLVWDEANLDAYFEKPRDYIPKNKMSFAGLKKPEDRADVIAYLKSLAQ